MTLQKWRMKLTMTSFENKIRKRLLGQKIKAVVICAVVAISFIIKISLLGSIDAVSNIDRLILIGLFVGGEVSSIRAIRKYRIALKSPEALEELHIAEADERSRIIILKTCQSTVRFAIALLGLGGIVASFFSVAVTLTISSILAAFLVLYAALALYYSRKY